MHAHFGRIGGVETGYVAESALFCLLPPGGFILRIGETATQESEKGFVRTSVVHSGENLIDLGEEVAGLQLSLFEAPGVAVDFRDADVMFPQWLPDFRRTAVDKFGPEFYGSVDDGIVQGEHPSADPVAGFENLHLNAATSEFDGRSHSGCAGAEDHNLRSQRHGRFILTRGNDGGLLEEARSNHS
jgi:hypothetical protein